MIKIEQIGMLGILTRVDHHASTMDNIENRDFISFIYRECVEQFIYRGMDHRKAVIEFNGVFRSLTSEFTNELYYRQDISGVKELDNMQYFISIIDRSFWDFSLEVHIMYGGGEYRLYT